MKKLQERINAQICQMLPTITAFGIAEDTDDLDKNTSGKVAGMKA